MTNYVLINPLLRTYDAEHLVLLIKKARGPRCVVGRLNLLGGHVETGEDPADAAIRELKEESLIIGSSPKLMGQIQIDQDTIYCYNCNIEAGCHPILDNFEAMNEDKEEPVEWVSLDLALQDPLLMDNLRLVLPLMTLGVSGWSLREPDYGKSYLIELEGQVKDSNNLSSNAAQELRQWQMDLFEEHMARVMRVEET